MFFLDLLRQRPLSLPSLLLMPGMGIMDMDYTGLMAMDIMDTGLMAMVIILERGLLKRGTLVNLLRLSMKIMQRQK